MKRFDRPQGARLALAAAATGALATAALFAYLLAERLLRLGPGPQFNSFHDAGRLFLERGPAAVYSPAAQHAYAGLARLPYAHPPFYTPLLGVLGTLPAPAAYGLWMLAGVFLTAFAAAVLLRGSTAMSHGPAALLGVLFVAAFFPLFDTLLQGQSDLLVLLPLAGAYVAWGRGRAGWAGLLGGLALVKPHLVLLVPALFLARRAWRALAGYAFVAALLTAVSVALSPAGALGYARLMAGWAAGSPELGLATNTAYSIRGLLELLPAGRLSALASLAILLLLAALALSWRPDVPRLDFALAVAASVTLSPFQNLHDLVLMIIPGLAVADLARSGGLRWPGAAAAILVLGYVAMALALVTGPALAAMAGFGLAAYLVMERLAVASASIPLGDLSWSGPRPHRVIVLPAYRAARTLKETVEGIPPGSADRILLVDDASSDATVSVATALRLNVIRHEANLGYGGNQKTCYRQALAMGADVVVMLHPDNQYDPAIIPQLCRVIEQGDADIVLGSRWLGIDPARSGMPWWKRLGNRFLTGVENRVLGLRLSEFHTGYRAYSRRFLEAVPYLENSNDFVFDTQILIQAASFGFRIGEVASVGRYFEEASSIGLRTSVVYGLKTLAALCRYVLHRAGFVSAWLAPASDAQEQPLAVGQPAHHGGVQ